MKTIYIYLFFGYLLLIGCNKNDDSVPPEIELQNEPPLSFDLVDVPNGTTNVEVLPTLSWESAKNLEGTEVTYDLYLGEERNPSEMVQSGISETTFKIQERLNLITDYYWKVVAKDANGQTSQSKIFKFTTRYYAFPKNPVVASTNFSPRIDHGSTVFDNKLWVIGGVEDNPTAVKNDAWYSNNGLDWNEATLTYGFTEVWGHELLVFDNKMWIIAGSKFFVFSNESKSEVWYTSDGANWLPATLDVEFKARVNHAAVVFDNKMWLIGGSALGKFNDVWYSTNGAVWTEATSSAGFSKRWGHSAVVFEEKIWVIGGQTAFDEVLNDVWSSDDGVHWAQVTAAAPFGQRSHHTTMVFDNRIWVIGGWDASNSELKNDVWYSSDGVNWTEATTESFSRRQGHSSAVFQDKLWVIGGGEHEAPKNDIWAID